MIPIDYDQYRLDLDKWNTQPQAENIEWDLVYSFLSEYDIKNIYYYENLETLAN